MLNFWWRPILAICGLVCLAVTLWWGVGLVAALAVLSLGLGLYTLYHLRQLARMGRWLEQPGGPLPECDGLWGDVLYRLSRMLRLQQRAQEKISNELEQMLKAARVLPDGVVMLDAQNRINWINDAAQAHLGLTQRDLGQFILYLLRNSRFSGWLMDPRSASLVLSSPVATERNLSLQLVRLQRGQKMLLSHDVTEQMRVDAMRRDFVANVSHELRTPITVIVGFLEAFADMEQPDPHQFKNHIELMREQSDRIRRLVDDLLTLARLEADADTKDDVVDVPNLVRGLVHEAQTLSRGRHEILLEVNCPLRLKGEQQEIHSALGNLVSNAVRYTPANGRITLGWRTTASGGAEFAVSDTGEGIEAHHIPRLTERFYRVDRGRSRATGGTGLGLAIVKHVLQRHQGRLRVESTVGKGSTFTAVFPAERIIAESARVEPLPGEQQAAA